MRNKIKHIIILACILIVGTSILLLIVTLLNIPTILCGIIGFAFGIVINKFVEPYTMNIFDKENK